MKRLLLLLIVLLSLVSCEDQSKLSIENYSNEFYGEINALESVLEKNLYSEVTDLLNYKWYGVGYSHQEFVHGIELTVDQLDQILYKLSILGPELEDEVLMKYQSKLEFVMFEQLNILKSFQDSKIYNTLVANQFTLYADVYELLNAYESFQTKYHAIVTTIEKHLSQKGINADESYYELRYKNHIRFNYWYALLSSQTSMYQDYTGLSVRPFNTGYINLKDNYFCFAPEMNSSVMIKTNKSVGRELEVLESYAEDFKINRKTSKQTVLFLNEYVDHYNRYIAIRSELPYDFFKSGEFTDFQVLESREFDGYDMYYFDHQYDDVYHFDVMVANYYALQTAIKLQPHVNYMMY